VVSQENTEELDFVKTHQPCPDCGSSDALAVNTDGSTKCFACGLFKPAERKEIVNKMPISGFVKGACVDLPARKIHEQVCKKYDYRIAKHNGKPCHVATFYNM